MSCSYDYCKTVKEKCSVVIIATSLHVHVDVCNSVTWCLVALYRGGHNYIIIHVHHVSYSYTIMTMHM